MLFLLLMYREILLLKSTYDEFIHEYIEDVIINIRKNLLTMVKKEKIEIMCNTQDLTYILNFVKYNPDIFVSKALSNIAECLSLSKSGLPGKNPGRPQSIEDTYRQKTAGKRDAIAVLLSIWPAF